MDHHAAKQEDIVVVVIAMIWGRTERGVSQIMKTPTNAKIETKQQTR